MLAASEDGLGAPEGDNGTDRIGKGKPGNWGGIGGGEIIGRGGTGSLGGLGGGEIVGRDGICGKQW